MSSSTFLWLVIPKYSIDISLINYDILVNLSFPIHKLTKFPAESCGACTHKVLEIQRTCRATSTISTRVSCQADGKVRVVVRSKSYKSSLVIK